MSEQLTDILTLQSKQSESSAASVINTAAEPKGNTNENLNWFVYSISGYCDSILNTVERIQLGGGGHHAWEYVPSIPIARTKFQAVVVPKFKLYDAKHSTQCLFVFGGKNAESQRIDSIDIFDPLENKWVERPDIRMRKPKSGFASVFLKHMGKKSETIMVIGGNDGMV